MLLRWSVGDIKAFQNSFAFIICKNHPESRLETLILHQKSDDKRTLFPAFQKGVSNPLSKQLCVYHLQKSPWKSFGNLNSTLESDNKRTPR